MPLEPPFPGAVLVEPHAHTSEVSGCGKLSAEEVVRAVAEAGYSAVVITDHNTPGATRSAKQCRRFARGYERARKAGDKLGVVVLPGMELRFASQGPNDFLVYLPDAALYALRGLPEMRPHAFKALADERGMLIYQAHPFRPGQHPEPPEVLHGVEVHNGNPRHTGSNARALAYAEEHGLAMLSGSDVHQAHDPGHGGIWVPKEAIASAAAFVAHLRATPRPAMVITDKELTDR